MSANSNSSRSTKAAAFARTGESRGRHVLRLHRMNHVRIIYAQIYCFVLAEVYESHVSQLRD